MCPLRLAVSVLVYGSFSAVSRAGKWRLSRNGHDGLFIFPHFCTFDEHKCVERAFWPLVVNLATGDWSISILVIGRQRYLDDRATTFNLVSYIFISVWAT